MKSQPVLFALTLLATAGLAAAAANNVSPDEFFRPGPTVPADRPKDQVYPKGTLFPFSFFSVGGGSVVKTGDLLPEEELQKEYARYKAYGFPLMGPQYELNDRLLADAKKLGLKAIYTVGLPMNFHAKDGQPALDLTPEQIRAEISQQVKAVADDRDIAIWYLKPEELRPWKKAEMAYLEAASKAIRESDPLGRPIWIYDPAHSNAKRMAAIAPWVDLLGKGMYPNYVSQKDGRVYCRWTIGEEIEAIKTAGSPTIPVAVPEMFQQPAEGELEKIPVWVKHDVFAALVAGAKGVFVFSARIRPDFAARNAYYDAYAEAGKWLLGEKRLGDVFLFGERRDDIAVDVTEGPAEVEFLFPSAKINEPVKYPSVASANIAFGPHRYLFLINSANEPVSVTAGGFPYSATRAQSLLEDTPDFEVVEGEFAVAIPPLGVKAFRIGRK